MDWQEDLKSNKFLKVCGKVMLKRIHSEDDVLEAMTKTGKMAERIGFPPKEQTLLCLATEEAIVNALEHGEKQHPFVEVEWETETDAFQLAIKQKGKRFKLLEKEHEPYSLRGRGLQLILHIMDKVWLDEKDGFIILYMKKYLVDVNEGKRQV